MSMRHNLYLLCVMLFCAKAATIYGVSPVHGNSFSEYQATAQASLFGAQFWWFAPRAFVVPLLFKLFAGHLRWLALFQVGLSAGAWATLAYHACALFRARLTALLVGACVIAMSFGVDVASWENVLGSESVSVSLFAFTLAATLSFIRRPRAWAAVWLVLSSLLLVFTRDSNAVFVVGLAGCLVLASRNIDRMARPFVLAIVISMAFSVTLLHANIVASERYFIPMVDNFLVRVLPNEHKRAYFEAHDDMPVSPQLMRLAGQSHHANPAVLNQLPGEFVGWVHGRGYSAYQHYLLTHPLESMYEAASENYLVARNAHPMNSQQRSLGFLDAPVSVFIADHWLFLVGFVLLAVYVVRGSLMGGALLFLLVSAGVQAVVCYHGDPLDLKRHSVLVSILFRLALIGSLGTITQTVSTTPLFSRYFKSLTHLCR